MSLVAGAAVLSVAVVTFIAVYAMKVAMAAQREVVTLARAALEAGRVLPPVKPPAPPDPLEAWRREQEHKKQLALDYEVRNSDG